MSTTACSLQSRAVGEPLAGTAPVARAWIVLEHPGPWGRDAIADSDLPDSVRSALAPAKSLGITVLLARRPARRGGRDDVVEGHRVWVARCAAGGTRLRTGQVASLDAVTRWDLAAIADGHLPPLDRAQAEPLLLVCTHGRRDACCAVHGRALLAGLAQVATPDQLERVWECSHVGGHRFAPVAVSLPDGMVHGRLSPGDAERLLTATDAGLVLPDLLRGRSCLPPPLQAAEVAVREAAGVTVAADLDALAVRDGRAVPVPPSWPAPDEVLVEVRHRDGQAWRVPVNRVGLAAAAGGAPPLRAESCGKDAQPVELWEAGLVTTAPAWHAPGT